MKVAVAAVLCSVAGFAHAQLSNSGSNNKGECLVNGRPSFTCESVADCPEGRQRLDYYCVGRGTVCCRLANSGGDPYVEGLAGQNFFFKPKAEEDAWYAAISDPNLQVNLKVHSYDGVAEEDPERDFYIGASIQVFDDAGAATQSLLVEVRDEENFDFHCLDLDDSAPEHCLGGGAIDVFVNGVRMLEPGHVQTGEGFDLAAANVIGSCQAIGETQLRHQAQLQKNRGLLAFDFEDYLLNRGVRHPADCDRWIAATKRSNGGIYKAPGTKSTIRFAAPRLTSVIDFDTRVPTDISVMPMTFSMGYFMQHFTAHAQGSEGFIGETATLRYDQSGQPIMSGKVLKAADIMYRVDGPFGRDFAAKNM